MDEKGVPGVPALMGGGGRGRGTGEGSGPLESPSHQQLFPASRRESLSRPISVRREGQELRDAWGLAEPCVSPGACWEPAVAWEQQ